MRFSILFSAVLMILLAGCITKKQISGDVFIDEEILVDVLVDLHLVDGVTNDRKFHRRFETDSIDALGPILEKHGVTKEMYDTTIFEYTRYPELFDQVYNEVLIRLNVMMDQNDQEEPNTPAG